MAGVTIAYVLRNALCNAVRPDVTRVTLGVTHVTLVRASLTPGQAVLRRCLQQPRSGFIEPGRTPLDAGPVVRVRPERGRAEKRAASRSFLSCCWAGIPPLSSHPAPPRLCPAVLRSHAHRRERSVWRTPQARARRGRSPYRPLPVPARWPPVGILLIVGGVVGIEMKRTTERTTVRRATPSSRREEQARPRFQRTACLRQRSAGRKPR